MVPYISLGTYRWGPKGRYAHKIGRELTDLTEGMGFKPFPTIGGKNSENPAWSDPNLHAEVRMTAIKDSEGVDWHQDGDTTSIADMHHGLIVWSNTTPTQVRWASPKGELDALMLTHQPEPFEVIYIHNLHVFHRRPPNAPSRRWHFRQRVEIK